MHGLILSELKRFSDVTFGKPAWRELLRDAGLGERVYISGETYPDAEVVAIVCGVAKGICRGVAKHYNEKIEISELTCMLKGKQACTIAIKLV